MSQAGPGYETTDAVVKTWHFAMSRWPSLWMWKRCLCNTYTSVKLL